MDVGLAEANGAGGDIFSREAAEFLDRLGFNRRRLSGVGRDAVLCRPGLVAVGLELVEAVVQDVVDLRHALFDHSIEAPQLVVRLDDSSLEGGDPLVELKRSSGERTTSTNRSAAATRTSKASSIKSSRSPRLRTSPAIKNVWKRFSTARSTGGAQIP